LNRFDTAGQRASAAQTYKDHRADLARAKEQLSWVPQHRPAATVESAIAGLKTAPAWTYTKGCVEVTDPKGRELCQHYHAATAELASAQQAAALEQRIAELESRTRTADGAAVMSEADPQASVLAGMLALVVPPVKVDDVQMALAIFIALLLEIGSAFGLYISLGHDHAAARKTVDVAVPMTSRPPVLEIEEPKADLVIANDENASGQDDAFAEDANPDPSEQDEAVTNERREVVRRYLEYCTVSVPSPREGTAIDELYQDFVERERAAGRAISISERMFQNLCSIDFDIEKSRMRLPRDRKGSPSVRKTMYAVRPVEKMSVREAGEPRRVIVSRAVQRGRVAARTGSRTSLGSPTA
jgi:hypothetical protein